MKIKFLSVLLLLAFLSLTLVGCGGKGTQASETSKRAPDNSTSDNTTAQTDKGGNEDNTGTSVAMNAVISSESIPQVVIPSRGSTKADGLLAEALRSFIKGLCGSVSAQVSDKTEKTGPEIVIGASSRSVSTAAFVAYSTLPNDENDTSFYVYSDGESIAVFASHEVGINAVVDYLKTLISNGQLILPEGFSHGETISLSAYYEEQEKLEKEKIEQEKKEAMTEFDKRWDKPAEKLDTATVEAFKTLAEFIGTDVLTKWAAGLWDPEIGGFYYANSARDYVGFLPDVESTYQALIMLNESGAVSFYGGLAGAIPAEIQAKIIAFVNSLEDPNDGYFYHAQWGKNIGNSRKGRDLTWSTNIYKWLGVTAPYPTALDRLKGNTTSSVTLTRLLADSVSAKLTKNTTLSTDAYLADEASFIAWLDSLKVNQDSHSAGHAIASVKDQIVAAGLGNVCCDYLDSKQNSSNGLWQEKADYTSLSGIFKLGLMYNAAGREMKYLDKLVDSAIEVMLSDANPSIIIYVYNPITALVQVIKNMKSVNSKTPGTYDVDSFYAKVRDKGPAILTATRNKLALFQKEDGSFSYNQKSSAPYTQGTYVSLGMDEGDLNATSIATAYIWNSLCSVFGISNIPLFSVRDCDAFFANVALAKPVEKKQPSSQSFDFEDLEEGMLPVGIVNNGTPEEVYTMSDPKDEENTVLVIDSKNGVGTRVYYNVPHMETAPSALIFETDIMIGSSSIAYSSQLTFGTGKALYMLDVMVEGNNVVLRENPTTASSDSAVRFERATWKVGEWVRLRVESYPGTAETVRFKIYVNDVCCGIGDSFFGSDKAGAVPVSDYSVIQLYVMKKADCKIYFDNLSHTVSTDATFSDSDFVEEKPQETTAVKYDFESGVPDGYSETLAYTQSVSSISADPKNTSNKVFHFVKEDHILGNTTNLAFATPLTFEGAKKLFVSFRFYLDSVSIQKGKDTDSDDLSSLNHNVFQIAIGGFGTGSNEAIYLLTMTANKELTGVKLGDASSISVGPNQFGDLLLLDTWYTVTIEISLGTSAADFKAVTSVDGVKVNESGVHYNGGNVSGHTPNTTVSSINIRPLARAVVDVYFDDIAVEVLK